MAKYQVAFHQVLYTYVTVEVPDESENPADAALELAYDEAPGDLCVHCSGHRQHWSRELSDELMRDRLVISEATAPELVTNAEADEWARTPERHPRCYGGAR
jgi:hypothetical protein